MNGHGDAATTPTADRDLGARQTAIVNALLNASHEHGLAVRNPSGLSGGSLIGDHYEAYIVRVGDGYQVETWAHAGSEPYSVTVHDDLNDAIDAAVAATIAP